MRLREIDRRHLVEVFEVADVAHLLGAAHEAQVGEQRSVVRCIRWREVPDRRQHIRQLAVHRDDQSHGAVEATVLRDARAVLDQRLQIGIAQGEFANFRGRTFETQRRTRDDRALALSGERGLEQVALLIGGASDDAAVARDDLQLERLVDLRAVPQGSDSDAADRLACRRQSGREIS